MLKFLLAAVLLTKNGKIVPYIICAMVCALWVDSSKRRNDAENLMLLDKSSEVIK